MNEDVHVLWTGGWDSTYRVLSLVLHQGLPVQPHYLFDSQRISTARELEAIRRITEAARNRGAKNFLRETNIFPVSEISISEKIKADYQRIVDHFGVGEQYIWLGEYARQHRISNLELCIHTDDKAYPIAAKKNIDNEANEYLSETFGRFTFPILDLSKIDMLYLSKEEGFYELMEMTWFCHNPTRLKKSCGLCSPCRWTIQEGLRFRLGFAANLRYIMDSYFLRKTPSFRFRRSMRSIMRNLG